PAPWTGIAERSQLLDASQQRLIRVRVCEVKLGIGREPLIVSQRTGARERLAHDLHVLVRHRLVLQPHGFESFGVVLVECGTEHLAVANLEHEWRVRLVFPVEAGTPPFRANMMADDDVAVWPDIDLYRRGLI